MTFLTEGELGRFLSGFTQTARRFEIREGYNSDVGREPFRRFLTGEPDDYAWHRLWMEKITQDRVAGKSWQRVRIVSVPPSDYTRYGLAVARLSVQAGEDIRYLRRDVAAQLGLEPFDAWILDDRQLIRLHFSDEDDTFTGAELVADRVDLARHLEWWSLAQQHAQSLNEFANAFP